jgi:hypothetical protein
VIVEKTRDFEGKNEANVLARLLAWFLAFFRPKVGGRAGRAPNSERIFSWKGVPEPDRTGYWRLSFEREDGERFSFIVDARPARKMSDDLMRAAVKMSLDVHGDETAAVERNERLAKMV